MALYAAIPIKFIYKKKYFSSRTCSLEIHVYGLDLKKKKKKNAITFKLQQKFKIFFFDFHFKTTVRARKTLHRDNLSTITRILENAQTPRTNIVHFKTFKKKFFFKHYLLESKIPVYLYINSRVQLFCHSNPVLIKLIFFCLFNHSCFNQFFLHSWTNYWNIILIQLNFITSANPTSESLNFYIYFLEFWTNNFF